MLNEKLQERVKRIVNQEVLTCQSMLVEKLLESEIVSYDDVVNMYPDNSQEIDEKQEELDEIEQSERYQELNDKYMDDTLTEEEEREYNKLQHDIDSLQNRIDELTAEQDEPQEIYEWWIVSSWLADQLKEHGEPILKSDYETWWGRTCTGQSIELDYVIQKIVEDIESKYGE